MPGEASPTVWTIVSRGRTPRCVTYLYSTRAELRLRVRVWHVSLRVCRRYDHCAAHRPTFLGRPPSQPFARTARRFAADFALPPLRPIIARYARTALGVLIVNTSRQA